MSVSTPEQQDTAMDMETFAALANAAAPAGRLHVALVSETYPPEINGVANTLGHLVTGLRARGHRVSIVRPTQDAADRICGSGDNQELLTRGLPIPGYQGLRFGMPARRRLAGHWADTRPDVIYVATEGPLGQSALTAARELAIPVVSGFHTNFDTYARFYRVGFIEPLVRAYLRRFHNRCEATLVPTQELAARLMAEGIQRASVLARGVDTEQFCPVRRDESLRREWGVSADDLAILYVGRVAAEKNLRLAIKAYEAIRRQRPGIRLVIVGDGPLREGLQRDHPDVVFAGARRGLDLARHYASGDLFLFPSTSETYGNVIIEAMASGLPVVCFDYAAGREHIRSGENGMLAPLNDEKAFLEAARSLAGNSELIRALGRAARATAKQLDWDGIVMRFEEALGAAIDGSRIR